MDMIKAMEATLELALLRNYDTISFEVGGVDHDHLSSMVERVKENPSSFSEGKLGRWLGYMQGVLVANDVCTLEEMKELNRGFADEDVWWHHKKRGSNYKIVGEARLQYSTRAPQDGEMLTLYRGEDGVYSVRLPEEFNDGRFERFTREST